MKHVNRRWLPIGLAALLTAFGLSAGPAEALEDSATQVTVTAVPGPGTALPGGDVPIAVVFDIKPGWHIWPHVIEVPPELGDPSFYYETAIKPAEAKEKPIIPFLDFLQPAKASDVDVAFLGQPVPVKLITGKTASFVPARVAADAPEGEHRAKFLVTYQACDDTTCLAPVIDQPVEALVRVGAGAGNTTDAALFADFDTSVWAQLPESTAVASVCRDSVPLDFFGFQANVSPCGPAGIGLLLLVAMLGGLLLNFTPCVLPVIPIKIMSLSQHAGSPRRAIGLGLVMSLGVVAFWLLLGLAIATVAGFTAANQLFQYPLFTLGVGVFIAVMAVGMTGMFAITLPQSVYRFQPGQETVAGSFMFGVLTAVLSTPCTAPFMGAAAAWAATQEPAITLLTFAAIGIGMALPYMVLSAFPRLVRKMPRTGPASQLIKEVMGLLMLATASYFIGVGLSSLLNQPPDPPSQAYWWVVAAFVAAAGIWLAWRALKIAHRPLNKAVFSGLGVLMAVGAVFLAVNFTDRGPIPWQYYTPERFAEAKADGKVVVMEFTAEWCLNCKALEQTVLRDPRIVGLLNDPRVVPMKVDLTGNNPVGNAMLKAADRVTIPLLAVFNPAGEIVYKSDYYTVDQVEEAIGVAGVVVYEWGLGVRSLARGGVSGSP